jgi:hypothetical protein
MTTSMKLHSQKAFLVIGIVFMILGLNNTAFVAVGAAFIAISAASARRQKGNGQVLGSEK